MSMEATTYVRDLGSISSTQVRVQHQIIIIVVVVLITGQTIVDIKVDL